MESSKSKSSHFQKTLSIVNKSYPEAEPTKSPKESVRMDNHKIVHGSIKDIDEALKNSVNRFESPTNFLINCDTNEFSIEDNVHKLDEEEQQPEPIEDRGR